MAGGMNRPGTPTPAWLREHHLDAQRPLASPPPPGALGPSRVHCWVRGPGEAEGWWPAVVVQWRRQAAGWVAQVAYVIDGGEPVLVVAWVAGDQLRPA